MNKELSIIENEFNIKDTYCVIENFMIKGNVTRNIGRHSDCLVFITEGSAHYDFGNYFFNVQQGDILYIAKNSIYSIDILSDLYKFIFVDFDFETEKEEKLESDVFTMQNTPRIEKLFKELLKEWIFKRVSHKQMCKSILYNIYAKIKESRVPVYIPSYKYDILNKSIQYIYDNFSNENISISYLAELSQISEVHFRRIFKEIHSVSPIKYITYLRINHAKDLLKYKNQSITNVSIAVGFQNVYYFSKVFKEETGMTPSEYRKSLSDNFNFYI